MYYDSMNLNVAANPPGSLGRDVLGVRDRRVVVFDVAGGPAGPGGVFLPAQDGPDDVLGGDRRAVVVGDRDQAIGQRAAQRRPRAAR